MGLLTRKRHNFDLEISRPEEATREHLTFSTTARGLEYMMG